VTEKEIDSIEEKLWEQYNKDKIWEGVKG